MTGRWMTVGLCALALAACHKKEAAKPPAPTAETPATPATTATTTTTTTETTPAATTETPAAPADVPATPPVDPTATVPTPPPPGVTPVTSPNAPPRLVPLKPLRVIMRPIKPAPTASAPASAPAPAPAPAASPAPAPAKAAPAAPIRIGGSTSGASGRPGGRPPPPPKSPVQVKAERDILGLWTQQKSHEIVNFTSDGRVTYVEKITDKPKWTGSWRAGADGVVVFTLSMPGATSSLEYSAYPTASNIMAIAPHFTKEWGGEGQYAYERLQ